MAEIVLVVGRQACDATDVLAVAATDIRVTGQGPIVSGTPAEAVQPLGAVRLSTGPFADDGPLVAARELVGRKGAGRGDVLGRALRQLAVIEDLVLMGVEHHVVDPRLLVHETVPDIHDVFERVMNHQRRVGVAVAYGAPTVIVEFLDQTEI